MMWGPVPVEGMPDLEARPITLDEMGAIQDPALSDVGRMAAMAYYSLHHVGGGRYFDSLDAAKAAPFPLVNAASTAAMKANGLSSDDPVKDAMGN